MQSSGFTERTVVSVEGEEADVDLSNTWLSSVHVSHDHLICHYNKRGGCVGRREMFYQEFI